MKKLLQTVNIIAFIAVLVFNYLSNTGIFNNKTIADVSDSYNSLITPADYAFSIWGLIYILLLGFIIYQSRSLFNEKASDDFIERVGWWFALSCLANILWIIFWLYGYTLVSLICIFILLFSLIMIILNNRMEQYDASVSTIAFLWWPIVVYCGWVTVATIINFSTFLIEINWNGAGFSETTWSLIMIIIAAIINILVIITRNMREFAMVGVWALIAIAVANWGDNSTIQYTALSTAVIIFIIALIQSIKNFDTNPINKVLRGEM